jgi:hypothetical protein
MTTATVCRHLAQIDLLAEAEKRAGSSDPATFRFRCPRCGHTQCAADLPKDRRTHVAQACFNCGLIADQADERIAAALWLIEFDDEATPSPCFPLADELDDTEGHSGPQTAPHGTPGTRGPLRTDNAVAPVPDAATLPSSPFLTNTGTDDTESEA